MQFVKIANSKVPEAIGFQTPDPVLLKLSEGDKSIYACTIIGQQTLERQEPFGVAVLDNFALASDQRAIALTAMQFVAENGRVVIESLPFHAGTGKIKKILARVLHTQPTGTLLFLVLDTRANKELIKNTRKALSVSDNMPTEEATMHNPLVPA